MNEFYETFADNLADTLRTYVRLGQAQKLIGQVFSKIAVRESQKSTIDAFQTFASVHRHELSKHVLAMLGELKPVFIGIVTFLENALPDMKITLNKYLDAKFEYLSFCLKVREMDDEEHECYQVRKEGLYRVETGNYEYRLALRCRQESRQVFVNRRTDVMEKLELLESQHIRTLAAKLSAFSKAMKNYHVKCAESSAKMDGIFPIESDFGSVLFHYKEDQMPPETEGVVEGCGEEKKGDSLIKFED